MLDNLFVGFAGDEVMTVADGDGVTVQNCEVGWVGDIVAVYNTGEAATGYGGGIQRLAGAIGGGNHGTRYRNNYVHHMYHAGGGIEIFEEQGFEIRQRLWRAVCGECLYINIRSFLFALYSTIQELMISGALPFSFHSRTKFLFRLLFYSTAS